MQPMQPGDRPNHPSRSFRARRTYPALPGMTLPTTPVATRMRVSNGQPSLLSPTQDSRRQRSSPAHQAMWKLPVLGTLLALLYLACYPLYDRATTGHDGAKAAWQSLFPWLPRLYWTAWTPIARVISHIVPINLASGYANLLMIAFALALVPFLLSARIARNVTRERLLARDARALLWIIIAFAALFGLLFVFAPALLTPDALLYGFYGRMVTVYHSNPYTTSVALPANDFLRSVLALPAGRPTFGPVWMDVALAITLFARSSAAILLDFRLLALAVHVLNTILIWNVLSQLRKEARYTATVLYAWNPVLLLLGVAEMHLEMAVMLFVLLAALFYQRRVLLLSWVCLLLSALVNPFALLLFPLFLSLLWKATRSMFAGRRVLWWLALVGISVFMVVLAYLPYWPEWSIAGIGAQIGQSFLPGKALQSLAASMQNLPVGSSHVLGWLASPLFWSILAISIAACLLLLGLWLTENLAFALLFASWLTLAFLALSPLYQPWFALLPLALAIASGNARTTLLAMLLGAGALLSYFLSYWTPIWTGQGLVTIGLPVLIWGWSLFFTSTWRMTRAAHTDSSQAVKQPPRGQHLSRPSWPSRPAWPGRK